MEYFREHYYDGKEEDVSVEILYEELKKHYLTVEQLRFCLDYAFYYGDDCDDLEIGEEENLTDALDMILGNNFIGFDKHFKIEGLDLDSQVYARHKLLLESEYLPTEIQEWLDRIQ